MPARLGFIGLGNMGSLMAEHLLRAGFQVIVHDIKREAAEHLCSLGAHWAETPAKLAEKVSLICLSLPGPAEMERVVYAESGVLSVFKSEGLLIDFTTNSPDLVRRVDSDLKNAGAGFVEAPVSGGISCAANGELTVQVGANPDDLERAKPVLDAVARNVVHVGSVGAGNICKLLHNCAVFGSNLALIECLTTGVKVGIDASIMIGLFQNSGIGRNHDLQDSLPATLFQGDFRPRFALSAAHKDLRLALELANSVDVSMPVAEYCLKEMTEALRRGWGDRDHSMYLTLQEERSGAGVRDKPKEQMDRT